MPGAPRKPPQVRKTQGPSRSWRHQSTGPLIPPCPVPPPPPGLAPAEQECWADLARQCEAIGTYDQSSHEMFVTMVRLTARVRALDPSQLRNVDMLVIRQAVMLHDRFGLNPSARARVPQLSRASEDDIADAEFLPGARPLRLVVDSPPRTMAEVAAINEMERAINEEAAATPGPPRGNDSGGDGVAPDLEAVLRAAGGNVAEVARRLGLSYRWVWKRCKQLGIQRMAAAPPTPPPPGTPVADAGEGGGSSTSPQARAAK